jgi:hypothetical protein
MPTPKLDPVADKAEPSDTSSPTPKSKSSKSNAFHSNDSSIDMSSSTATITQASLSGQPPSEYASSITTDDNTDAASTKSKRSWFKKKTGVRSHSRGPSESGKAETVRSDVSLRSDEFEDDVVSPLERNVREDEWRLGDDMRMQLDI